MQKASSKRQVWVQRVMQAQSGRAPEEMEAARARIETARQHEACARKCKAVRGFAVRSRALAAEGLRQLAEAEAPEDYAAVQDRWRSAQEVSRARQLKKCKRLGRGRRCRRRASGSRSRSASPAASSCSAGSAERVLRAASDSEEDAMEEAAGLVGASDVGAMAATGEEGLVPVPPPAPSAPRRRSPRRSDADSSDDSGGSSEADSSSDGEPLAAAGGARGGGVASTVQALLQQLRTEPADAAECAAKFQLYEGYGLEVEGMRSTLLQFHEESKPTLPPAIVTDMDRQVRGIDSEDAMRIPDESREWFVYHMMRQAERNNLKMASILDGMEKKLKFLAANDQVECPVCLDTFGEGPKGPETLGCCHKVCKECWHHWARVMHGRPFCPFCRHEDFLGAVAARASSELDSSESSDGEASD